MGEAVSGQVQHAAPTASERTVASLRGRLDQIELAATRLDDPTPDARIRAFIVAEVLRLRRQLTSGVSERECYDLEAGIVSLAGQTIELHGGLAVRRSGLDCGLCEMADRLLGEVSAPGRPAWSFASIPANSDAFGERDFVVRVRWPGDGVWTLPLALHELGHFVGRRLEERSRLDPHRWEVLRPVEARLRETGVEMPVDWNELHEFFADAYAAFVGGPAFLGCCVAEALDPRADSQVSASHPAPSRRIAAITELLRRMDALADNSAHFGFEIEYWVGAWAEARRRSGQTDSFEPPPADRLVLDFCWDTLIDRIPAARFRTMNEARQALAMIRDAVDPAVAAGDLGVRRRIDVVNAAWCGRRQTRSAAEVDELGRAATSYLGHIGAHGDG